MIKTPAFLISVLRNVLISGLLLLTQPAIGGSLETILARVQSHFTALEAAQNDYRQRRSMGSMPTAEDRDYQAYISLLQWRFLQACTELEQFPIHLFKDQTPCPAGMTPAPTVADIDLAGEQTPGERSGALVGELDAALGDFDELLLREQQRVKAATPPPLADVGQGMSSGEGTGSASGAASGSGQDRLGDAAGDESGDSSADSVAATAEGRASSTWAGQTGSGTSASGMGTGLGSAPPGRASSTAGGRQTGGRNVPPDIPDGSDDDVVARQLREAAEKETDPQLRARLWEEYRKYKRGT